MQVETSLFIEEQERRQTLGAINHSGSLQAISADLLKNIIRSRFIISSRYIYFPQNGKDNLYLREFKKDFTVSSQTDYKDRRQQKFNKRWRALC